MNLKLITVFVIVIFITSCFTDALSQERSVSLRKKESKLRNWHNLDIKKNRTAGISTEKAYNQLLKNKRATTVIVAVIDGGIDINHEDLKDRIWTNVNEIPGNGIDDDHNGFVDDIHGWNFLGGSNGEDVEHETVELTRLYRDYTRKFQNLDTTSLVGNDILEYAAYKKIRNKFFEKFDEIKSDYTNFQPFKTAFNFADSIVQLRTGKKDYTLKDLKKFDPGDQASLKASKEMLVQLYKKGFKKSELIEYSDYLTSRYFYHYNILYNPRTIVGDNPEVMTGVYGNNDIVGPDATHGTFVAGIIAAERNNGIGIDGIADSVKIMVLRAIPDGDEYDKDVANAIIYAVNNGAKIINCSFGKSYSPQKHFVEEALKLAKEKDVLIIHAAGNESEDNDSIRHYPENFDSKGGIIDDNWITVGASSQKIDENLAASFSNYGRNTVDIFAPGYRIYSSKPFNKYGFLDGTSFSSPMVAGAAALIKSYYPTLTAGQIKDIILQSGEKYPDLKVLKPSEGPSLKGEIKIPFSQLSRTGSILNIYNALKLAETYTEKK